MKIHCIFDIHGRFDLLDKLLIKLNLDLTKDKLVFIGDYIDRGPQSMQVIDVVMDLQERYPKNVIALMGNHEQLCLLATDGTWQSREGQQIWFNNGGYQTIMSYGEGEFLTNPLFLRHRKWMVALPLSYECPGFFFSHATIPIESRRWSNQGKSFTEDELLWNRESDEKNCSRKFDPQPNGEPTIGVCGHTPKLTKSQWLPRLYPHYIFGDTGCGKGENCPICCIEVTSRDITLIHPDKT